MWKIGALFRLLVLALSSRPGKGFLVALVTYWAEGEPRLELIVLEASLFELSSLQSQSRARGYSFTFFFERFGRDAYPLAEPMQLFH